MSLILTSEAQDRQRRSQTLLDRVVGLVPIEVISAYAVLAALAGSWRYLGLAVAAGAIATVVVLTTYGRQTRRTARATQHLVRVLVFVAWAFVLSNPLTPAAPVARWLPAVAVVLIPLVGAFMFPSAPSIDPPRRG
ncbi:MAG: hypothetical protein IPL61_28265 [Myxococcales bacterium]|nr:hypothetical protein [Myxococcales bacterium]